MAKLISSTLTNSVEIKTNEEAFEIQSMLSKYGIQMYAQLDQEEIELAELAQESEVSKEEFKQWMKETAATKEENK